MTFRNLARYSSIPPQTLSHFELSIGFESALAEGGQILWDPPIFHLSAKAPSIAEGFCIYGTWALTDLGIAVLSITVGPSCFVLVDGGTRRREPEEIPNRHGGAGIDSDALEQIRLIDLRERLWRSFVSLKDRARIDIETIESERMRKLLTEIIETPDIEMPRRRGRPEDVGLKVQRAQDVIDAYELGVVGARKDLVKRWARQRKTMSRSGVSTQIGRLVDDEWLIKTNETTKRYSAGARLIAEQERSTDG